MIGKNISPQGYNYDKQPINVNPFWEHDISDYKIIATAEVDDTTGTPNVTVDTDQSENEFDMHFEFTGLKGETGAQGPKGDKGDKGDTGETGPQGPKGDDGLTISIEVNGQIYQQEGDQMIWS